ncbi:Ubl carboxyl-terminal hydrolase 18 [Dissostichus eleginoides]|uniref:Ubl carboxyl-terminal hydrolase 18 n=1 Tax=Dissostichus eleginoides TaxID=100907 RepID=A0AAD9FMF6_DISEL|nr:Ubl carboxyl-terminal hydrolase 18 [Dissostichus eleginoides]
MRGLSNHQLSCCVNTLLQTFSATWELGDILDKWEAAAVGEESCNIPLQLKRVLSAMRKDTSRPAPHHAFLHSLDLNRIRLGMQHDADEVFLSILNLLQHQMDDKHLTLNTYLLSLPLHVKEDHDSLEGCMTSFFEHQELRGINCCFCAKCEKKTPSKKGVKLLSLPRILSVHLKRFRNSNGYTRKLDCRITFPETFDFAETVKEAFSSDFNQNDCKYTLHAVVVHSGYASSGHYTAYVRHRGNQCWYYADDSHVHQVSWKEVQRSYGGITAYMLMYRRGSKEEVQQPQLSG